jgi:predicted  nucleic acid-binding Zn-ribbon protein
MPAVDETTQSAIQRLELEMAELRSKMKTIKDDLKDIAEQNEEYRALQDDIAELANKRKTAKKLLQADKDYQVVNSELEQLKFKYKDLEEIMSHHLVTYFKETQESEITDSEGEERQILFKAKLGK